MAGRVVHPPPTLGQRLDPSCTVAFTETMVGFLAYGTANAAAAQVLRPHWLAVYGPSVAMLALLVTARWGAYHGPVVSRCRTSSTCSARPCRDAAWLCAGWRAAQCTAAHLRIGWSDAELEARVRPHIERD